MLRHGAPSPYKNQLISKHRAWLNIFCTAEEVLWAGDCPIHPPFETQNPILAKMRSEQQIGSMDWHVGGTGMAKQSVLTFITPPSLPLVLWSSSLWREWQSNQKATEVNENIAIYCTPFPSWQGSAPSPMRSTSAGKSRTALPGRQRRTSASYVHVCVVMLKEFV